MSPPLVSAEIGFEVTQLSKKELQDLECRCKTRFTECCIAWIEGGLKTVRPLPSCSLKRLWSGCPLPRCFRKFFLLSSKFVRVSKVLFACNCKIQNWSRYPLPKFFEKVLFTKFKIGQGDHCQVFEKVLLACNCKIQNLYKNLPLSHVQLTRRGRSELKGLLAIMYIVQCTPISWDGNAFKWVLSLNKYKTDLCGTLHTKFSPATHWEGNVVLRWWKDVLQTGDPFDQNWFLTKSGERGTRNKQKLLESDQGGKVIFGNNRKSGKSSNLFLLCTGRRDYKCWHSRGLFSVGESPGQ